MLENVLLRSGRLTGADLERAQRHAEDKALPLDGALTALGLFEIDELVKLVAQETGAQCLGGSSTPDFDTALRQVIPRKVAVKYRVAPLEKAGRVLVLAAEDASVQITREEIGQITGLDVQLVACLPSVIDKALATLYAVTRTKPAPTAERNRPFAGGGPKGHREV